MVVIFCNDIDSLVFRHKFTCDHRVEYSNGCNSVSSRRRILHFDWSDDIRGLY